MLNTITNVTLTQGAWTNIYTASGLAVGSKIYIQNQSSDFIKVFVGTTPTDNAGDIVEPFGYAVIAAGVSGAHARTVDGAGGVLAVSRNVESLIGAPIDERVYTGYKAITIQSFSESNSKNGTQFSLASRLATVAIGSSLDVTLTTGSLPVIIKGLLIQYTGSQIETVLYKNTVFTGGSTMDIYNLNTNGTFPLLSTAKSNSPTAITISNAGTQVAPTEFFYGVADQGNRATPSLISAGLERILAPNTTYMRRIWNRGSAACVIDFSTTFYEGEVSNQN